MTEDLKTRWVEALRSGKYTQGIGKLRSHDNEFCCLGVLCDVAGVEWEPRVRPLGGFLPKDGYPLYLITSQLIKFGISDDVHEHVMEMNDTQKANFEEIADWLEALEDLNAPLEEA